MKKTNTIAELQSRLAGMNEALHKSQERATAGMLALELMHEIRNPLEAVGNLSYLALQEAENPEAVKSYMRLIDEQLTILDEIGSNTLGLVRSSHAPQQIPLATLAEAALRIHQRTMLAQKIHIVKDLSGDLVTEVYTTEMLQVISNLVVNALDALPRDGTLFLRLRKRGDEIHFVIADNGHGIPPEHIDQVFEPFFTTKTNKGTGLGLALSKRIVERNGGKIRLRSSVRLGKRGTTFKISLPA